MRDAAGTLYFLLGDQLGSTTVVADSSGNLTAEQLYQPWGAARYSSGTIPTSYQFTGQRHDSFNQLYLMGARWYDPYLNRWVQPDSIVPEAGNPQSLNRYSFVANNPVKYIDPSGHCWGFASGLRNTGAYGATCNNMDMALTIVQSPNASGGEKALAGGYVLAEGAAHVALAAGVAGLACVAAGPGCVAAVEGALGIGAVASADGDPANEVQAAIQGVQNTLPTPQSVMDKLQRYLLNPTHPQGGDKAAWFEQALGFTRDNAADLAKQIIFDPSMAVQTEVTQYGIKFNQTITIVGANGKQIDVLFAWIQNNDGIIRLVTGIPTGQ